MIAPTHITFAEFLYLLILTTTGIALSPLNAITIGVASLLPDIDTGASTIGKCAPFISQRIERRFGHRTITHSIMCVALLALVLVPLAVLSINVDLYICFLVGYASHPFLDTMTINGVKLFYPFSNVKCVFPLEVNQPHRYRIRTGSKLDKTLAVIFLFLCIPTFFIAHKGYERFIRFTQATVESAVRDYHEYSKTHKVFADIRGHDLLTKEQIVGTFELVGALNSHSLVFRGKDGSLRTLGHEYEADYVADHVLCTKGTPVTTWVRTMDMANQILQNLSEDSSSLYFGTIRASEPLSSPPRFSGFSSVTMSGHEITFNYASYDDILKHGLDNVLIEQGTLIARTLVAIDTSVAHQFKQSPYVRVASVTSTDHEVQLLVQQGDTVYETDPLARLIPSSLLSGQIALSKSRQQILEQELERKIKTLNDRIARQAQRVRNDSSNYLANLELLRRGFRSRESFDTTARHYAESLERLQQLVASEGFIRETYALRIRKLQADILKFEQRLTPAGMQQSVLRSTASGVIADIRIADQGKRRQITFIIRRLP